MNRKKKTGKKDESACLPVCLEQMYDDILIHFCLVVPGALLSCPLDIQLYTLYKAQRLSMPKSELRTMIGIISIESCAADFCLFLFVYFLFVCFLFIFTQGRQHTTYMYVHTYKADQPDIMMLAIVWSQCGVFKINELIIIARLLDFCLFFV